MTTTIIITLAVSLRPAKKTLFFKPELSSILILSLTPSISSPDSVSLLPVSAEMLLSYGLSTV